MGAALEAFAAKGFYGASMRTIASTAGTSLSNLYNYFPSKDDLLLAVLERANSLLLHRIESTIEHARPTPRAQLQAAVRAYVGFTVDNPEAATVALSEFRYLKGEHRARLVKQRDRTQAHFLDIIDAGRSSGEFATTHPHEAARAVLLLCATIANWYRPQGQLSAEAIAEVHADFALALVEARHRKGGAR